MSRFSEGTSLVTATALATALTIAGRASAQDALPDPTPAPNGTTYLLYDPALAALPPASEYDDETGKTSLIGRTFEFCDAQTAKIYKVTGFVTEASQLTALKGQVIVQIPTNRAFEIGFADGPAREPEIERQIRAKNVPLSETARVRMNIVACMGRFLSHHRR